MNRRLVLTFVLMSVMTAMAAVQEGDEAPPRFTASGLLTPAVAQGPHYRVDEDVPTVGYFHEFKLSSDFGPFEAIGRSVLAVRIQEIGALAALQDVSKTEVFLSAAGQSVVKIGQGAAAVVSDPGGTVKGVGAGIKRFGVNLGRRTEACGGIEQRHRRIRPTPAERGQQRDGGQRRRAALGAEGGSRPVHDEHRSAEGAR